MQMARSRRKRGQEEHQNHDRWLITYADLITLLLIFFIILYSMSKIDLVKFEQISLSLSSAIPTNDRINIESPPDPGQDKVVEDDVAKAEQERVQLDELKKKIEDYIQSNNLSSEVNVIETERGVQITLNDAALFKSGDAVLKQEAQTILGGLAPFLKLVSNEVEVEGHTDDVPIKNANFRSNWELSAQRAINVLHFFDSVDLPAERMHAVGYAHTQPLVKNDSDQNRASNRRVNLVVLRTYKQQSISPF